MKWIYFQQNYEPYSIVKDFPFCQVASRNNNFEMLKWLYKENFSFKLNENCHHNAIKNNNLEMLEWIEKKYPHVSLNSYCVYCSLEAIENGNLDIIKWMHEKRVQLDINSILDCKIAVKLNNLELLKWFRSQNPPYPLDKEECISVCFGEKMKDIREWIESQ